MVVLARESISGGRIVRFSFTLFLRSLGTQYLLRSVGLYLLHILDRLAILDYFTKSHLLFKA